MNSMRLWAAAGIIGVIIIAGFALSVPHTRDIGETRLAGKESGTLPAIEIRDTFKKGTHTITGSVEVPNACSTVFAEAALSEDASSIVLALSVSEDTEICLQVPQKASFRTTLAAPADLPISVTINGAPASATEL